jgi:hypothetical protein
MTRQIIIGADEAISQFMQQTLNTPYGFESGRGVGMAESLPEHHGVTPLRIIAGIWFEAYNGANMMIHVSALPNSRWMTKELLWYTFYYPFVECGCKRVTGLVEETNTAAREFDERIGFHLETRLKDAAPNGDLLVYAMFRDECRWLKLRDRIPHLRRQVN